MGAGDASYGGVHAGREQDQHEQGTLEYVQSAYAKSNVCSVGHGGVDRMRSIRTTVHAGAHCLLYNAVKKRRKPGTAKQQDNKLS